MAYHTPLTKATILRALLLICFFVCNRQTVLGQDSLTIRKTGIYTGLNFGTWFPERQNKVLGHPPMIGFTADVKYARNAFGLNFDLIGWPKGKTTAPITVKLGDSAVIRNEYFGAQCTFDYYRQRIETKRWVIEGMCAIGYGDLTYYNPDEHTDIHQASWVGSPGISIRYIIKKTLYLQWKTQYCIANYDLNDPVSTDLRGNYWTTKLIVGGLSN